MKAALEAGDQLRQRVAWALAQILVISPKAIDEGVYMTESMVTYYDIFVSKKKRKNGCLFEASVCSSPFPF